MRCSESLEVVGPHNNLIRQLIATLSASNLFPTAGKLAVSVEVSHDSARHHVGLGTGTQLALSVARAVCALFDMPEPPPAQLAPALGRGIRSAIGTHGFFQGGLLLDGGNHSQEQLSPLLMRVALPQHWRFLLVTPDDEDGMFGQLEKDAMNRLPAFPAALSASMCADIVQRLFPAAETADFDTFSTAIYEYGTKAGLAFASEQEAGIFRNSRVAKVVFHFRQTGVNGVGQTSWGPTVFALFENEESANEYLSEFRSADAFRDSTIEVAAPANSGAVVRR